MDDAHCNGCTAFGNRACGPILPNLRPNTQLLFLVDYPTEEDAESGRIMTGLSRRAILLHRYLKSLELNPDAISFASVIRCVTRSKAAVNFLDYERCSHYLLEDLKQSSVRMIVAFGTIAGRIMTGVRMDDITAAREKSPYQTVIPDVGLVVTYALSILQERGCSGCGKNVYPFLTRKDIEMAINELRKRGLV